MLGGLFLSALVVLTMVTIGLFQALGIRLPDLAQQLLIVGGAGMIPVLAVAILYDPARPTDAQAFDGGLIRLLQMLLRLFLPLTAAVLVVYLCIVPFYCEMKCNIVATEYFWTEVLTNEMNCLWSICHNT